MFKKVVIALFLFLFLLFPKRTFASFASEANFLIIHQIRGKEACCEKGSLELIQKLKEKKDLYGLSFAWALRFDALEDSQYINLLKNFGESGLLLEVTPNLASKSGVLYKGKKNGSDWHFAKNVFLVGYEVFERKKIIDTLFNTFREKFGFYPKFTVSWMIDAWSLNYLHKNYQVELHQLTKEQYEIDSYTLYGGIFNAAYYPTRRHPLIPGRKLDKLNLVIVRQTISDIIKNYGAKDSYYTSQPNDYLKNPLKTDISYFQTLIKDTLLQPSEFQFGVLGFENSYSWKKYGEEYLRQLEFVSQKQKQGKLKTILPSDYALKFKKEYQDNPSFFFVKNFTPEEKLGVLWYFGETYRARIILKKGKLILDDLRIYLPIDDPYSKKPSKADYSYFIVPYLIDGSQQYSLKTAGLWRRGGIKKDKEEKLPGGSIASDTITSPFGIILGEGNFSLKTDKSPHIVEIEFTGKNKGLVKLLPQEILIDRNLKPSFAKPYQLFINDFFNTQKEINLRFKRHFDFSIKWIKNNLKTSHLWQSEKGIAFGWKRDDTFISLLTMQRDNSQFILTPLTEQENLRLLNPIFQPDLSGLTIDPQKSVFYWNNKEAVAGRNPIRLFILPLNSLERPVQIKDIKVNLKTEKTLDIVFPDDYSYRIKPWFIDISSDIPLKTQVGIVVDGKKVVKDIPIEFVSDCQRDIKACIATPGQLVKYLLILLKEKRVKLSQYFR